MASSGTNIEHLEKLPDVKKALEIIRSGVRMCRVRQELTNLFNDASALKLQYYMYAAINEATSINIVKQLLDKGSVLFLDIWHPSHLVKAANLNRSDIYELLLKYGTNVNQIYKKRQCETPLMCAITHTHEIAVERFKDMFL